MRRYFLAALLGLLLLGQMAHGALVLDPNVQSAISSTDGTTPESVIFSTTNSNDIILIFATVNNGGTYPTLSTNTLSFTQRTKKLVGSTSTYIYEWNAIATNAINSNTITLSWSSGNGELNVFAISGANILAPFDPNSDVPTFGGSSTNIKTQTTNAMTTNNAAMYVMYVGGGGGGGAVTYNSPFTQVVSNAGSNVWGDPGYNIYSSGQSGIQATASWTTTNQDAYIFDAVDAAAPAASTCTPTAGSSWAINCADHCVESTGSISVGAVTFYGSGYFIDKGYNVIATSTKWPGLACSVYIYGATTKWTSG